MNNKLLIGSWAWWNSTWLHSYKDWSRVNEVIFKLIQTLHFYLFISANFPIKINNLEIISTVVMMK